MQEQISETKITDFFLMFMSSSPNEHTFEWMGNTNGFFFIYFGVLLFISHLFYIEEYLIANCFDMFNFFMMLVI